MSVIVLYTKEKPLGLRSCLPLGGISPTKNNIRTDHASFSDSTSVDKVLSTKSGKYCGMRASRMPSYLECS